MNPHRKIRVLVVDDSAVVRQTMTEILNHDPELEVVGTACDPYVARDKILALKPDVLTLDLEMPRMDGLTFLKILQAHRPMPVVVVSSISQPGSRAALEAMALGAVEVVAKPSSAYSIDALVETLPRRVKAAACSRPRPMPGAPPMAAPVKTLASEARPWHPLQIILMGASTGGTEALKELLSRLPAGLPPICIVQHIPPGFSAAFAERLNSVCPFEVREAAEGDGLCAGLALVAPGDQHVVLQWVDHHYRVSLRQGTPVNYSRPSVDVLFNSAAPAAGRQAVAALLTGMGRDGAQGMKRLKEAGAVTLAQDEATCVVYGMPRAAVELNVVDRLLPLHEMPQAILDAVQHLAPGPCDPAPTHEAAACRSSSAELNR
jgi:two-component system, chemotaxis family, protein-glutamate methylesterase/glutaminase